MRMTALAIVLSALALPAMASCPAAEDVARFAKDWRAKSATKGMPVRSLNEVACVREALIKELGRSEGAIIGYKAALTGKAAQERFKADGPVSGALFASMILPSGSKLPAPVGGNPVFEADMLLVVKDDGINQAKTPEEAVRHISGMRPFIEIPDLMLQKGDMLEAPQLIAMNAAGRVGIAGAEVPLAPTLDTVKALADVKISLTDAAGKVLAESTGAANLGSPLNVVIWLVKDLAASGRSLKAGDVVSIGSFSPLFPVKAGETITVRYEGLAGTPSATVAFP